MRKYNLYEDFPMPQEMREHTDAINSIIMKNKLKAILKKMEISKDYSITVNKEEFSTPCRQFLEERGYKVSCYFDREKEEEYYVISWKRDK